MDVVAICQLSSQSDDRGINCRRVLVNNLTISYAWSELLASGTCPVIRAGPDFVRFEVGFAGMKSPSSFLPSFKLAADAAES